MKNKNILVVVAHPDDEILGCGATVAKLVKEGYIAYSLVLCEGITSRDKNRNTKKRKKELGELKKQAVRANGIIGVKDLFAYNFPDNRLDTVALLDIVKAIEGVKNKVKPSVIFTHYEKDLNIDHKIIYQAVITAARPSRAETVKEIYSFEVLSSTEWNYPLTFMPDVFFDISKTLDIKLKAMGMYASELKEYPHPRSIKFIEQNAAFWGVKTGVKYAEAFKLIRLVK